MGEPQLLNRGLPAQTADLLARWMAAGRMRDWLPSERRLCRELQISRGTLRAALEMLRHRNLIRSAVGRGHRVRRGAAAAPTFEPGLIGLLAPEPLEVFRPHFAMRFDHLQRLAALRRWRILRVNGAAYFSARAGQLLPRLVQENRCECWVLLHSNERVQRWFADSGLPCVVAGRTFPGVDLPAAGVDYRASARHAAGHLLQLGHTHIGLLVAEEKGPGLAEGEAGFVETCQAHRGAVVRVTRIPHDNTVRGTIRVLTRQLARADRPTALVVETSNQYLAAASVLHQLGLRLPDDVSLISRVSDPFLDYLVPVPCRYEVEPRRAAEVLIRLIVRRLNGTAGRGCVVSLTPEFLRGSSTTRPPRAFA
jgi:LacI family transcriptional regulator